jgi:hypothetical protein
MKMVDIIEEDVTAVIKKFTTRDGSVFISEGHQDWQIKKAKEAAEFRNLEYDFLHFKVDENLLKTYKSENWLHFKWFIYQRGLICNKINRQFGDDIYEPYRNIKEFNNITEQEFRFFVKKMLFKKTSQNVVVIKPSFLKDKTFFDLIFFSGLIDFNDNKGIIKMYMLNDGVKEENFDDVYPEVEKYYLDRMNDAIFGVVALTENTNYLEEVIKAGILKPTLEHLSRIGYYRFNGKNKILKGTKLNVVKYDITYKFEFPSDDKSEEYFKKYMSLCPNTQKEILYKILFNHNYYLFIQSNYGMLCMYYQYFHNMTELESFKKAEEIHSAFLLIAHNKNYSCLQPYAKFDEDLYDIIINVPFFTMDAYSYNKTFIPIAYRYLIDNFPDRKAEIDIYAVWSSEGSFIPEIYKSNKTFVDIKFYIKLEKLVIDKSKTKYNIRYTFSEFKKKISNMAIDFVI